MIRKMSNINSEHDILLVDQIPDELGNGIALAKLTAYSLFWMQEWGLRRTIEAVSVLNWRLFPNKFAMIGFPQLPDSLRTNRSLMQGQPKYQNLLTGSATKGFSLNQHGLVIARDLVARLGEPKTVSGLTTASESTMREIAAQQKDRARTIDPSKDIARIRDSILFEKWKMASIAERDIIHVHTLLGIFEHTPGKVRREIFRALVESAQQTGDIEADQFLREIHRRFYVVFTSQS